MDYRLIVSRNTNDNIDSVVQYVTVRPSNPQAARAILNDIDVAYDKLEERAEIYLYYNDLYLAHKGYRKLPLDKHNYVILYQLIENEVHIGGVFHTRENYVKKL